VVVTIYRDDYYDKSSREPGVTELIVTKQRNGRRGRSTSCSGDGATQIRRVGFRGEQPRPPRLRYGTRSWTTWLYALSPAFVTPRKRK
jgi:hypothetical protein